MTDTTTQTSPGQRFVKFLLWCLRRPIPMWFVLLFGIWTFINPVIYVVSNWRGVMFYFGATKLVEVFPAPIMCLAACVLAFCLRKESIAFLLIYFGLYAINLFQFNLHNPLMLAGAAVQVFIGVVILWYLFHLRKSGKLR